MISRSKVTNTLKATGKVATLGSVKTETLFLNKKDVCGDLKPRNWQESKARGQRFVVFSHVALFWPLKFAEREDLKIYIVLTKGWPRENLILKPFPSSRFSRTGEVREVTLTILTMGGARGGAIKSKGGSQKIGYLLWGKGGSPIIFTYNNFCHMWGGGCGKIIIGRSLP